MTYQRNVCMKVFLSSTYSDLREHRRQVLRMVDRFRHGGADWEWFGMEAFGARDDLPIDACLKFVDECDLYVGLFGVRYGSRDEKSGLSMTEVEYRRAVTKKKPRLIFLIDETNAKVAPKDFEESAEGREKLKRLIDDLRKDRVTDSFGTPEDLGTKVVIALATHYLEVQKAEVGTKQDDPLMLMAAFGHEVSLTFATGMGRTA